jgi:hypothetical protein
MPYSNQNKKSKGKNKTNKKSTKSESGPSVSSSAVTVSLSETQPTAVADNINITTNSNDNNKVTHPSQEPAPSNNNIMSPTSSIIGEAALTTLVYPLPIADSLPNVNSNKMNGASATNQASTKRRRSSLLPVLAKPRPSLDTSLFYSDVSVSHHHTQHVYDQQHQQQQQQPPLSPYESNGYTTTASTTTTINTSSEDESATARRTGASRLTPNSSKSPATHARSQRSNNGHKKNHLDYPEDDLFEHVNATRQSTTNHYNIKHSDLPSTSTPTSIPTPVSPPQKGIPKPASAATKRNDKATDSKLKSKSLSSSSSLLSSNGYKSISKARGSKVAKSFEEETEEMFIHQTPSKIATSTSRAATLPINSMSATDEDENDQAWLTTSSSEVSIPTSPEQLFSTPVMSDGTGSGSGLGIQFQTSTPILTPEKDMLAREFLPPISTTGSLDIPSLYTGGETEGETEAGMTEGGVGRGDSAVYLSEHLENGGKFNQPSNVNGNEEEFDTNDDVQPLPTTVPITETSSSTNSNSQIVNRNTEDLLLPPTLNKALQVIDKVWDISVHYTAKAIMMASLGLVKRPAKWVLEGMETAATRAVVISVTQAQAAVASGAGVSRPASPY